MEFKISSPIPEVNNKTKMENMAYQQSHNFICFNRQRGWIRKICNQEINFPIGNEVYIILIISYN